jgi:hypothetical protein
LQLGLLRFMTSYSNSLFNQEQKQRAITVAKSSKVSSKTQLTADETPSPSPSTSTQHDMSLHVLHDDHKIIRAKVTGVGVKSC